MHVAIVMDGNAAGRSAGACLGPQGTGRVLLRSERSYRPLNQGVTTLTRLPFLPKTGVV